MNLGIGFPESISKTRSSGSLFYKGGSGVRPKLPGLSRQAWAFLVLTLLFGLLLFQTIRLQLVLGSYYRVLSEQNRVKTKILHASRGTIYDRDGSPLVINVPGFREKFKDCTSVSPCTRALTRDEVLRRKAKGEKLEDLEIDSLRQYTKPKITSHVLGYIAQSTKEELENASFREKGYILGDQVGRGGVEEQYEDTLRGQSGRELIETDAKGDELRILGKIDPIPGADVMLALDSKLQEVAYEAMVGKTGAVIVSDPKTGEILTLLSMPSFDANLFTLGPTASHSTLRDEPSGSDLKSSGQVSASDEQGEKQYKTASDVLLDRANRPLFNRAISGTYPPGSTFKIITAAAGLEKGVIDEGTQIVDTGVLRVGEFSFSNWYFTQYGKTEGPLAVVSAIRRSNDIFFYKVAEGVGVDGIKTMAQQFGLSKPLGIDVPGEVGGLVPSATWKKEAIGEEWYLGDTYHLGIGQGYILTTPLQMNAWTGAIANNGTICQPTVLKTQKCKVKNEKFLQVKTITLIKEGMREACDTGGTGWPLFKFKIKNESASWRIKIDEENFFAPQEGTESGMVHIPVACKTGTAEFGDSKNRTHAWFTAYAPIANPQIVVTVLVEGGGEGSTNAAPIAKKIFEEWFSR